MTNTDPPHPRSVLRTCFLYLALIAGFLTVPNVVFFALNKQSVGLPLPQSEQHHGLIHKTDFFLKNKKHFNVLFLGDSTTHQNIDPEAMDTYLPGSHSYNLGWLMHWFPTQYVHYKDLLPQVPKQTLVVWTIRHGSFFELKKDDDFRYCYPIRLRHVPDYIRMGYTWRYFGGNVFFHNFYEPYSPWVPGMALHAYRKWFYDKFEVWMNRRMGGSDGISRSDVPPAAKPDKKNSLQYRMVKSYFLGQKEVTDVGIMTHEETVTAAIVTKRRGNQVLVELEPAHFRAQQRKFIAALEDDAAAIGGDREWNLYLSIVELFRKNDIRLVINDFEYTPMYYRTGSRHDRYRGFMERVRAHAAAEGIPFVRVDYDQLADEHFYDIDHMNIRGMRRYNQLLGQLLAPYLNKAGSSDL